MDTDLFVYGTLRDPDLRAVVLATPDRALRLRAATAMDWCAVSVAGGAYPVLVEAAGAMAHGMLLGGLSRRDFDRIGYFETKQYRLRPITVKRMGQSLPARAYLPIAVPVVEREAWAFDDWQRGVKPAFIRAARRDMANFAMRASADA